MPYTPARRSAVARVGITLVFVAVTCPYSWAGAIDLANNDTKALFTDDITGTFNIFVNPPSQTFSVLGPWISSITITELGSSSNAHVDVTWSIRHVLGPHQEDVNPNAPFAFPTFSMFPGGTPVSLSARLFHPTTSTDPPGPHLDDLVLNAAFLDDGRYGVSVTAIHSPEPGLGSLVGLGLTVLTAGVLRRGVGKTRLAGLRKDGIAEFR